MGKILKWPILYIAVQFGMIFLCAFLFVGFGYPVDDFALFLEKYRIVLVVILSAIFIPLLRKEYTKEKEEKQALKNKDVVLLIGLGLTMSIIYNTVVYYLNDTFGFTNLYGENTYFWSNLVSVGILGPVLEEYMFRGVMYRDLKKQYSNVKSILICTTIFALLHFTFVQTIYAFAFGVLLIIMYNKYQNIQASILLHITSNLTTMIWTLVLIQNHFAFNYVIYLLSILFVVILFVRRKKIWYNTSR